LSAYANTDCSGNRFKEKIFEEIEFIDNVIYATKQRSDGLWQHLGYDVYMPAGDIQGERPAIMLAHGGGYIDFIDQKSPDIVKLAREFAQRGYVVFSVEYREEPSPFSLFSVENMVKAVGRALIDIRDVTCHLMDTTITGGNPYGVDPEQVIVGGVSAGAVSFLQAVFLDSLSWLPQQYQEWILEVEPNTQALLDNKYCGANVRGIVNISGALLDTFWIKDYKLDEYPAIMSVHGGLDPIVPYGFDHPFGLPLLPRLMGSEIIDIRTRRCGLRHELDFYPSQGHVPILGVNWNALLTGDPIDFIFNQRIMNATLDHMTEFIFSLIDCDLQTVTAIDESQVSALKFFPNPSANTLTVVLPERPIAERIDIVNQLGQAVLSVTVMPFDNEVHIRHDLPPGVYAVVMRTGTDERPPYTGQLIISR
jgi:hypothetical protein